MHVWSSLVSLLRVCVFRELHPCDNDRVRIAQEA